MEAITALTFFILGVLTGMVSIITITLVVGKRAIDKRKKETETEGKKIESVGSRMKQIKDLTSKQLELQAAAEGPQMNALHGRHKNGLIGQIKEMEAQKNEILKSILTDGFDPEISVIDSAGVVSTIRLSEFLAQTGTTPPPPKGPKPPTKQVGKFTVHKGGKDDGGNTTH